MPSVLLCSCHCLSGTYTYEFQDAVFNLALYNPLETWVLPGGDRLLNPEIEVKSLYGK